MKTVAFILWGNIRYDGRVQKEIRTLQENGYRVELIIQNFNNDVRTNYNFKIHSFNFKPTSNSIINFWLTFKFSKEASKLLHVIRPDIVHCNDLNTLCAGYLYKKSGVNFKLIYDSHELFPEQYTDLKKRFVWNMMEKRMVRFADEVILPEKYRAKYFSKKYGLTNIHTIENYPLMKKVGTSNILEAMAPKSKSKVKLLYIGSLSPNRGIEEIVRTMPLLPESYCLFIIGSVSPNFEDDLKKIIEANNLIDQVFIFEPVDYKDVLSVINSSDIGLLFYNDNTVNDYYCASNKLFEFIVCRKYVVTNDYPAIREVLQKSINAQFIKDVNPTNIAEAILRINVNNIPSGNIENFFWNNLEKKFLGIYA